MKLNENNIDVWLHNNLKDASSGIEDGMLADILQKNKSTARRRKFILWLNLICILLGLGYSIHFFNNRIESGNLGLQKQDDLKPQNSNAPENNSATNSEYETIKTNSNIKNKGIGEKGPIAIASEISNTKYTKIQELQEPEDRIETPDIDQDIIKKEPGDLYIPREITNSEIITTQNVDSILNSKKGRLILTGPNLKKQFSIEGPAIKASPFSYEISVGYIYNKTKIIKQEQDVKHTHKSYQSAVSDAFNFNNGIDITAGLRYGFSKYTLTGAINYSHSQQVLQFKVPNWEAPVIDQNGEIRGYIELEDSVKKIETQKSVLVQNEVSLPLTFSLKQNITPGLSLELGLGILPKLRTFPKLRLPGTADMQQVSLTKIKANFSSPMTIRMGLYKKLKLFSIGVTGIYTPFYNSNIKLPGELAIKNRQTNIQLSLIKPL